MANVAPGGIFSGVDDTRIADHNTGGRNVKIHEAVGRDHDIITDADIPDHGCVDSDGNAISDRGYASAFSAVFSSDCAAFVKIYITPQPDAFRHSDVIWMSQIEAFTDICFGRDLQPIFCGIALKPQTQKNVWMLLISPQQANISQIMMREISQNIVQVKLGTSSSHSVKIGVK